jgi:L-aminopeptidase/D-esterase-like protein
VPHDPHRETPSGRPRARALGVPFRGTPGAANAITDVGAVEVGYRTLVRGDGPLVVGEGPVRTGVTAIHPHGRAQPGRPSTAGWWSINGNGEMTGTTWIDEVGVLTLPIAITNTHAVGTAHAGIVRWTRGRDLGGFPWSLPVAAETWDGWLSDLDGLHVTEADVMAALDDARPGPIDEGSVGGGTGMVCYGFKGGSGTASRVVDDPDGPFTVGAFVQANFGSREQLVIAGVPVGLEIPEDDPEAPAPGVELFGSSIIVVLATDAPLLPGQCKALARRAALGVGRSGSVANHSSGDIFLAFATGDEPAPPDAAGLPALRYVPWGRMDTFYEAVVQAVDEAIVNVLVANETMTGIDGRTVHALPHARLVDALRRHGRLSD